MIIRALLLSGLAAIGWLVFLRRNRLPIHIVIVFALLAMAGVAVVFPSLTDPVARAVGVGRGADLITYVLEVGTLFVLLHYYTKFVELERRMTAVVRELAILRAELDRVAPPAPAAELPPPTPATSTTSSGAA